MSKRIILFGPLPPPHGGVAIYMEALLAHLGSSNIRVWTYSGRNPRDPRVRFVAHRRLGTLWALLAEGRGARILDASHFHLEYPNPLLLTIWLGLKRSLGFKWYKNILDGSLPKRYAHFGTMRRWMFHRAINAVDEFVVVSDELRRWVQEDLKLTQPVTVIPCLLPKTTGAPQTLSDETSELLRTYASHEKRVCSIGVFYPAYGFRDVAEAVEQLRERNSEDIGLLLLDGGFVRAESYRDEVLSGRDWITVLEKVANSEIPAILKSSDVFVRAVEDEGFGISRVEAIWAGTPVVATRVGATSGMLLYDFGDVEQLASRLQSLLFSSSPIESNSWAAHYQNEAEANLQILRNVLGIKS